MSSSPEQNDGAPVNSDPVCIDVVPQDDPTSATSHDSALGARVQDSGLGLDQALATARSSQTGPGSNSDSAQVLDVDVPSSGDILRGDVLRSTSTSTVTGAPAVADHTSTAETANVNLLNGTVTASKVRGVAFTRATGISSSYSSAGSAIEDLFIDTDGAGPAPAVAYDNVSPNTTIELSPLVFGEGSFVKVYEEIGSTSRPAEGTLRGGTYAADLTVRMLRVHVTDRSAIEPGNQTTDIVVSQAVAHSDFPQTTLCELGPRQSVSGHAFIASESTTPAVPPALVGYVEIPSTGGSSHQQLESFSQPADGSVVSAKASESDSTGSIGAISSASSYAQATNPCVLPVAGACSVGAQLVKSQASSNANGTAASSDDSGTVLIGATVQGVPINSAPPPNTVVQLPGIGYVIFNEQFCDAAATLPGCAGTEHSGLTVRAIHVVVTVPDNPLGLSAGTEIIVAEAHSDATFR
jgi:hypothetical protein